MLKKPSSGCTCRSHASLKWIAVFTLSHLFVLEQSQTGGHPSPSAVMVLGKVTLAQRKTSPGSFHTVAVAV